MDGVFNLGLSLTKRLSPEMLRKPFIVKFDVYNIIQTTVQFQKRRKKQNKTKKTKVSEPRFKLGGEDVTGAWEGEMKVQVSTQNSSSATEEEMYIALVNLRKHFSRKIVA